MCVQGGPKVTQLRNNRVFLLQLELDKAVEDLCEVPLTISTKQFYFYANRKKLYDKNRSVHSHKL